MILLDAHSYALVKARISILRLEIRALTHERDELRAALDDMAHALKSRGNELYMAQIIGKATNGHRTTHPAASVNP